MVKRQRRMTTRKKTGVKKSVPKKKTAKPTKVKKNWSDRSNPGGRKSAKTDRANQAMKVLLKGLNQTEETE